MFPALHETRGFVFGGVAYRVADDVINAFSSNNPHGPMCFEPEIRETLSAICVVSTASDVQRIPMFDVRSLWEFKVPCAHVQQRTDRAITQHTPESPPHPLTFSLWPTKVNILYYPKTKEIVSDELEFLLIKCLKEIQSLGLQIRNSELEANNAIVSDITCQPLIVRTTNGRIVPWRQWIHHGPMSEPGQSIPLNIHFLTTLVLQLRFGTAVMLILTTSIVLPSVYVQNTVLQCLYSHKLQGFLSMTSTQLVFLVTKPIRHFVMMELPVVCS